MKLDLRSLGRCLAKGECPLANDLGDRFSVGWLFAFAEPFWKNIGIGSAAGGKHGSDGVIVGHV